MSHDSLRCVMTHSCVMTCSRVPSPAHMCHDSLSMAKEVCVRVYVCMCVCVYVCMCVCVCVCVPCRAQLTGRHVKRDMSDTKRYICKRDLQKRSREWHPGAARVFEKVCMCVCAHVCVCVCAYKEWLLGGLSV